MIRRWVTRAIVASLLALGLPVAAGLSPASAAPTWLDGSFAQSTVINCQSLGVLGTPYTETGVSAFTGYIGDLEASTPTPAVGQTFYMHVVIGAPGNPCPNQYTWVDLGLPAGLTLATASSPMYCLYDNVAQSGCDATHLMASPFHSGAISLVRSTDGVFNNELWPVPTGHMWEFQIPVKATSPIINATLHSYIKVLDGNDNPWLDAHAQMLVQSSAAPSAPTIFFASPSTAITPGATPAYMSVGQIRTDVAGTARFRLGTTTAYSLLSDTVSPPLGAGSYQAWDDWTPFVPVAGTVYHWTLCFKPTNAAEICGADQTFTGIAADGTPPTLVSVTPLAPSFTGNSAAVRVTFSEPVSGIANGLFMGVAGGSPAPGSPVISPASGLAKVFIITIPLGLGVGDFNIGVMNVPQIKDAAGNSMSGSGASTVVHVNHPTLDTIKPVITTAALPGVSLGTVVQKWTASDLGGLASFAVSSRTISSAGAVSAYGKATAYGPAARAANVAVTPGVTRCVHVTATDTSSNATTSAQHCTTTPFDERVLRTSGVWAKIAASTAYGRTLSRSVKVGSAKYLTGLRGHAIIVVAQKARGAGTLQVLLNGRVIATWSLAATRTLPKQVLVVPVRAGFSNATVSVRVKVAGSTGVWLDGFGIGA